MNFLTIISENSYLAVALFCLVMLMSEWVYGKKCWHYNVDGSNPAMKDHMLTKRYHLDQREGVDIQKINLKIARSHCAVILLSSAIMLLNLFIGALFFFVGNFIVSYLVIKKIGDSYSNHPFKTS